MKPNVDFLILIGLLIVMYINPNLMARFANNILGKLVMLGGIIYLTEKHTILGLLLAVIFIAAMQSSIEGMSTSEAAGDAAATNTDDSSLQVAGATTPQSDDADETDTDAASNVQTVTEQPKKKSNVSNGKKDGFTTLSPARVTSGRELISLDEMLRPAESNMLIVNEPMGAPPSENLLHGQLDIMNPVKMNGTMNRGYLPAIF
jgi:hypothetical protein